MSDKDIKAYIEDALSAMDKAEGFVAGLSYGDFVADDKTVFAVVRAIEMIGEAIKHVPPDTRARFAEIPWREIVGMRDVLIHEYFSIDLETVWHTVKDDIPRIRPLLQRLLLSIA